MGPQFEIAQNIVKSDLLKEIIYDEERKMEEEKQQNQHETKDQKRRKSNPDLDGRNADFEWFEARSRGGGGRTDSFIDSKEEEENGDGNIQLPIFSNKMEQKIEDVEN